MSKQYKEISLHVQNKTKKKMCSFFSNVPK